tara:strand:- start:1598 stop:1840 length:243 start_codon:yes stop_codon:yes gene_type:complete
MTKLVYIVRTNHDGIIGVYTNKKLAYQSAQWEARKADAKIEFSYSQVLKKFKNTYINNIYISNDRHMMVEIQQYPLNNKY